MRTYHTPLDLVRSRHLENPVVCRRPERLARANRWFQENFPGDVLYAVKANPSDWVIDELCASGSDFFEVASLAEVELIARRAPDARIAFLHPVKSRHAIRRAYHDFGVRIFAIDTHQELEKILEETDQADDLTLVVRLAVSSDFARFSLAGKFGVTALDGPELIQSARHHAHELGVSFHIGSQCMEPIAFRAAMLEASRLIVQAGVTVDIVDVGGGFPCIYPGMTPPAMQRYIDAITDAFQDMLVLENAKLWCEPGRALVAEAESLIVRVDLRKDDTLYINDGSYGALFDAAHAQWRFPVRMLTREDRPQTPLSGFKLFGPTCDSIDALDGPFDLPSDIDEGDFIEIGMIGAYGVALTTQFNGFGAFDHVFVQDDAFATMFGENNQPTVIPAQSAFIDEGIAR
ncbi:MAG: type III PLP-dependent enzyme [Alphaproteobacteria bacterium]|nr:type III PLP-dependent enzyme [Alphaproteobacteria bacterium]